MSEQTIQPDYVEAAIQLRRRPIVDSYGKIWIKEVAEQVADAACVPLYAEIARLRDENAQLRFGLAAVQEAMKRGFGTRWIQVAKAHLLRDMVDGALAEPGANQ